MKSIARAGLLAFVLLASCGRAVGPVDVGAHDGSAADDMVGDEPADDADDGVVGNDSTDGAVDAACPAEAGFEWCGGRCVDTSNDPQNCGGCGNDCRRSGVLVCLYGGCAECPAADTFCPDRSCHDTHSDPESCGSCGHACGANEVCADGECRLVPGPDF